MERIEHLIETFRADYPSADPTMLLEFAQHLRRVLLDELRQEVKADNQLVKLSLQVHGQHFSAQGPRSYVEGLLQNWQGIVDAVGTRKNITPGFNRMRMVSGSSR